MEPAELCPGDSARAKSATFVAKKWSPVDSDKSRMAFWLLIGVKWSGSGELGIEDPCPCNPVLILKYLNSWDMWGNSF